MNKVKRSDIFTVKTTIERIHRQMKEGYNVDGEFLAEMINSMLLFLDDVIEAADKKNVKVNGEPTRS